MFKFQSLASLITLGLLLGFSHVMAKAACPVPVLGAVEKAYPGSTVSSCMKEKEKDAVQYEVKFETKSEQKLEIDVSPEGSIKLVEGSVVLDSVPKAVISAFKAKYPKAQIKASEKQTKAEGTVTYELAFKDQGKKHEATFKEDGTFVELE